MLAAVKEVGDAGRTIDETKAQNVTAALSQ